MKTTTEKRTGMLTHVVHNGARKEVVRTFAYTHLEVALLEDATLVALPQGTLEPKPAMTYDEIIAREA
jgi:hypothetical protein